MKFYDLELFKIIISDITTQLRQQFYWYKVRHHDDVKQPIEMDITEVVKQPVLPLQQSVIMRRKKDLLIR